MNQNEYLEQNARGFEGDTFLRDLVFQICNENTISTIVELGS